MPAIQIKKDDEVLVLAGKDRGKRGTVVELLPKQRRVTVDGVNVLKRHRRPSGPGKPSGIIEFNGPIDLSNVMLVCPKCDVATRISKRLLADGTRVRTCKKCGEVIDE
jgi:large subunit ribosomal protein L24